MSFIDRSKAASKAAFWHLGASLAVAAVAAFLVFGVWYPYPYRELAGGRDLFLLVVAVDVVCGPLLTLVLFNPKKPRWELATDLGLVVLIQLAALAYGIYSLAVARPVYLVFEVDRFRVVSMADIPTKELRPQLTPLHRLSWLGPRVIGVREPNNPQEKLESLDLSLQGLEPSARPDWWRPYEESRDSVLTKGKRIAQLRELRPQQSQEIDLAVRQSGTQEENLLWIPLTGFKSTEWVVFIDSKNADVKSFAPVDGF